MNRVIYIDVLVSVNFLLDWLLLRLSGKLAGAKFSKVRCCLGALVGALFSFVILLPNMGALFSFLAPAVSAFFMCLVAFGAKKIKSVFRASIWLFLLSACYAGLMLVVWLFLCPAGMEINNGFVYIDIGPELIILCAIISYVIISLLSRYGSAKNKNTSHCTVKIKHKGKCLSIDGLVDTGNLLTEPISGLPVIVAEYSALKSIVPYEPESLLIEKLKKNGEKIRIVPYNTVGGSGLGAAFMPEEITVVYNGSRIKREAYILPLAQFEAGSLCSAVVGATLIEN